MLTFGFHFGIRTKQFFFFTWHFSQKASTPSKFSKFTNAT